MTAYLDFAEVQALNRRVMTMQDWIAKLDDFLKLSERQILMHAGRISHEKASEKAELELQKFRVLISDARSPVEQHFATAIAQVKQLAGNHSKIQKKPKGR